MVTQTFYNLGPVVQSIVSLTSSLRGQLVKYYTILLPNIMIFLLKKCEKLLQFKSFSNVFNKKKDVFGLNIFIRFLFLHSTHT